MKIGKHFKSLVSHLKTESEIEARECGTEHLYLVLCIYDIVGILVLVLHITRTKCREGLRHAVVDLQLTVKESYSLKSVALSDPVALGVEIVIFLICLILIDYLGHQI